jgi:acyl CoA:acetate/3-ketoacid CoA transferase beta subunit
MVSAVCHTPLGAHPHALISCGIPELGAYGDDYDFLVQQKKASRDYESFNTWAKEWVLDCSTHEDYLAKLGQERIDFLKSKAAGDMWKYDVVSALPGISTSPEYNPVEMMIIAGVRKVTEKVLKNNYKVLVGGFGASSLVAWMAYYQCREQGADVGLATASGCFGHEPRPGDPMLASAPTLATCKMLTDVINTSGIFASGIHSNNSMCVYGTGEIDKYGNLNSTVSHGVFVTGAGGGNDSANARESVALLKHNRERFMSSLPYITIPGHNVRTVISTLGIFEKLDGEELMLTGYFPNSEHGSPVDYIKENCGWDLKVWPQVTEIPAPSIDELLRLRLLDPRGYCSA